MGRWSKDLFFFFGDHLKIPQNSSKFWRVACGSIGVKGRKLFKKPEIWNLVIFFLDLVMFFGNSSEFWKVACGSIDTVAFSKTWTTLSASIEGKLGLPTCFGKVSLRRLPPLKPCFHPYWSLIVVCYTPNLWPKIEPRPFLFALWFSSIFLPKNWSNLEEDLFSVFTYFPAENSGHFFFDLP